MKEADPIGTAAAALSVAALLLLALPTLQADAQSMPPGGADVAAAGTGATRITYVPPTRGAPSGRIGGSTRGPATGLPNLEVLAPDHIGLSATPQPTLHWFIDAPVETPVEIVLDTAELTGSAPLLEVRLPEPPSPGINAIDLAAHGVRLDPGTVYRWSVAVVIDPNQRSSDLIASGLVRYVPPDQGAGARATDPAATAIGFASQGYWYDAMTALTQAIAAQPGQEGLRRMRAELLQQVGLVVPASFDRAGTRRQGG